MAFVTGAAGNIGVALCRLLSAHGVSIAAADLSKETLEERLAGIRNLRAYQVDVCDLQSVKAAVDGAIKDFGHIDILFCNAGVWNHSDVPGVQRFEQMDHEEWTRLLRINLDGTMNCCQAVLPHMIANGYGRIVNTASISGEVGLPGYADYAAAKAGVILFSKTLAMENAGKGITVNCVSPGMVAVGEPQPTDTTWVGRKGAAHEMARAMVFLAADESGFITGVDLPVEGGRTLGPVNAAKL
ncbi:MAG: SDR family oxidoreductase [Bacteroidales bacterium]|nr:SDR family oxidoreductase [Bacteroidales bacterium]